MYRATHVSHNLMVLEFCYYVGQAKLPVWWSQCGEWTVCCFVDVVVVHLGVRLCIQVSNCHGLYDAAGTILKSNDGMLFMAQGWFLNVHVTCLSILRVCRVRHGKDCGSLKMHVMHVWLGGWSVCVSAAWCGMLE